VAEKIDGGNIAAQHVLDMCGLLSDRVSSTELDQACDVAIVAKKRRGHDQNANDDRHEDQWPLASARRTCRRIRGSRQIAHYSQPVGPSPRFVTTHSTNGRVSRRKSFKFEP
jgi:hypothetical protein